MPMDSDLSPQTTATSHIVNLGRKPLRASHRYYLRQHELQRLTGQQDYAAQAHWLKAHRIDHNMGVRDIPLVRRSSLPDACFELPPEPTHPLMVQAEIERIQALFATPGQGLVYLVDEGSRESPVKFGYCYDAPLARLAGLQTGNPRKLRLLGAQPGSYGVEQYIHGKFAEYRLAGEWFEATPVVARYVEVAVAVGHHAALEALAINGGVHV